MKVNWINILAALLIGCGIFFLVRRANYTAPTKPPAPATAPTTSPITNDQIKDRFISEIERSMGRPLNDVEKQMITVDRHGNVAQVTLLEPLKSRLVQAEQMNAMAKAKMSATTRSAGIDAPAPAGISQSMTPMPATMP